MNKQIYIFAITFFLSYTVKGTTDSTQYYYQEAYNKIIAMLNGTEAISFKDAVFHVENAYTDNQLSYSLFDAQIKTLSQVVRKVAQANEDNFVYDYKDRLKILYHASLFHVMTDTVNFIFGTDTTVNKHLPFTYDFFDIQGKNDWTKMFVTKLLFSKEGNCHSLPYLYKILAENLELETHLALAPNHMYIKHRSEKTGMYNTELTSAAFPIDAWLMTSGYIHLNAIESGIYMQALDDKQSLALCLIDLAQGYQKKSGKTDDEFIMKCCETALQYHPNYINALLLKAEIFKSRFDKHLKANNVEHATQVFHIPEAKQLFEDYETLIVQIHQLGYRKMPEKMYLDWLLELKENQEKYLNKEIINNLNISN